MFQILSCVVAMLCGCSASRGNGDVKGAAMAHSPACLTAPIYDARKDNPNYEIQPGDELDIAFYLNSEFDDDVVVQPDGKIALPLIGNVTVGGFTPAELAESLDRLYSRELRNPGAVVRVDSSPSRLVYVEGQVAHPGAIPLQTGMTALQAIAQAGGLTDSSGVHEVVLIRRNGCGEPHGERIDLGKVLNQKDNEEDIVLMPTDILVVPMSGIAQLDLIVKQYVRDLLPVTPYLTAPMF
jgi:protein involved in polysaccharide export with SLBB domain